MRRKSASRPSPRDARPGTKPGFTEVEARDVAALAAKAPPIEDRGEIDTSDIPETDFGRSDAVRGKYYARFLAALTEDWSVHQIGASRLGGRTRDGS